VAYIYVESTTSNSVTLVLDELDDTWENGTRTVTWYIAKGYVPSATSFDKWTAGEPIENNAMAGGLGTFSNLEPDTEYYVYCEVYHGSDLISEFGGENDPWWFVTDAEYEEPDEPTVDIVKWTWTASNGSASAMETLNSYVRLTKGSPTDTFYNTVWKDMVDKVWEIIEAKTNWWDGTYASYYDTKNLPQNSDGLYELTAVAFNSLRNNIELVGNEYLGVGRIGIPRVYAYNSNYPVKASYFTTLTNYMNACIDNL
jgi:hypothetical protein